MGGENSVSFQNAIQNIETLFNTPAPVQPRQKKFKKTNSLKPPESASSTLMKYIIEQKNSEQSSKLDAMDQFFFCQWFNGQTVFTVLTTYCEN